MLSDIRRYFFSGLLLWLPIWTTVLVIKFLVGILNNTISLLPHRYQPDTLLGFHIPGIGVFITLTVIFITGLFVANIIGKKILNCWESLVERIPLVNTIYTSVKQVCDTLFTPGGNSFHKVLLIEYPKENLWTIAFQTGNGPNQANDLLPNNDLISVFVPATPNPTGGFLMLVARTKTIELDMTVEQALKYIISLGVVQP